MKFTVVWFPSAQQRLAELWLEAGDKQRLTEAADRIDSLLMTNPLGVGEARTALVRYIFQFPIGVYYQVRRDDKIVEVRAVWRPPSSH
jgi:hypothetical protein